MERPQRVEVSLRQELSRLARFGANIVDAHSCFILLPSAVLDLFASRVSLGAPNLKNSYRSDLLELAGYHSLSNDIVPGCIIPGESGLLGWVAKHQRPIHVSPFEHDSRTLGTYAHDQQLKSFMGVPISVRCSAQADLTHTGVVACDSKKAFAFSKLQGKLLEEFAAQVSETVQLHAALLENREPQQNWIGFLERAHQLADALSMESIEILRIRFQNASNIETRYGTSRLWELYEQVERLIQQALPPHFPLLRLPTGELLLVLDNMMTSFYEAKISAICSHLSSSRGALQPSFIKRSWKEKGCRNAPIEELISRSSESSETIELQRGMVYEHRRA
ncbi:MAG: GAF domain-containing protein [Oligoflexia bacterium]|nr:GAF domain-containing protein [Oligoflexia bacterium]